MINNVGFEIEPIPDETFLGLVIAAGILRGATTYKAAYQNVLGLTGTTPANNLPRNVHLIGPYFPPKFQSDPRRVCLEHTLLPYYSFFTPPKVRLLALDAMLTDTAPGVRQMLGISRLSNAEHDYVKYCRACAGEQITRFGRSTWLRSHQLPGVNVCHRHGIKLLDSSISKQKWGLHNSEISLPEPFTEITPLEIWSRGLPWDKSHPHRLIAQVSHELLLAASPLFEIGDLSQIYRNALLFRAGSSSKVDWLATEKIFRSQYGDLFGKIVGVDFLCGEQNHWLRRIVSSKRMLRFPMHHVIFIGCLFDSIDFLRKSLPSSRYSETNQHSIEFSTTPTLYTSPKTEGDTTFDVASKTMTKARKKLLELIKNRPGITRGELHEEMRGSYVWLRINDREWMNSNLPPKAQPKFKGRDKRRNEILEILTNYPNFGRTQVFEKLPETYRWLQNNDSTWLAANLPPRKIVSNKGVQFEEPRKNWTLRDEKFAKAITILSDKQIIGLSHRGGKVNFSALSRLTGMPCPTISKLRQYPATSRAIAELQACLCGAKNVANDGALEVCKSNY